MMGFAVLYPSYVFPTYFCRSMPRNRVLMRVFRDVELVESLGSGMTRILSAYERFMPVLDEPVDGEAETGTKTGMKTGTKAGQKTRQKTRQKSGMDTVGQGLCRRRRPRRSLHPSAILWRRRQMT